MGQLNQSPQRQGCVATVALNSGTLKMAGVLQPMSVVLSPKEGMAYQSTFDSAQVSRAPKTIAIRQPICQRVGAPTSEDCTICSHFCLIEVAPVERHSLQGLCS